MNWWWVEEGWGTGGGGGRRPRNKVYLMFADHVATKATFFLA